MAFGGKRKRTSVILHLIWHGRSVQKLLVELKVKQQEYIQVRSLEDCQVSHAHNVQFNSLTFRRTLLTYLKKSPRVESMNVRTGWTPVFDGAQAKQLPSPTNDEACIVF